MKPGPITRPVGWSADKREFALAALRVAHTRARLVMLECESAATALRANLVSPDTALVWLDDVSLSYLPDAPAADDAEVA